MVLLRAWLGLHTGKDATGTRLLATRITVAWGATALIEPTTNVGDIEYQSGKLPKGYTPIEEMQLDAIQKILDDFLENSKYSSFGYALTNKMEEKLKEHEISSKSIETVMSVMDSGDIPPNVSKPSWNRLAKVVNGIDFGVVYKAVDDERKYQEGRQHRPGKRKLTPNVRHRPY